MTSALVPLTVRVEMAHAAVQRLADLAHVDVLHIKGPAVHPSLRGRTRVSSDVDVLVRPEGVQRLMALLAAHGWRRISEARLAARVGRRLEVIVDDVDEGGATCRTKGDAPEIDGNLFIDKGFEGLAQGDIITVEVDEAGEYDLWARRV